MYYLFCSDCYLTKISFIICILLFILPHHFIIITSTRKLNDYMKKKGALLAEFVPCNYGNYDNGDKIIEIIIQK